VIGNSLAVPTAPMQDAQSAFADWILTRAGGFRASRCRDFNRQRHFQAGSKMGWRHQAALQPQKSGNSLAVQTAPMQDAKSAFADWILTRAGRFRASRCRDFNRQR